ncbi:putative alcohol O-acetyltransferase [Rosa chinensis]|uniref:Putative alcohol O-acetyltransferase n=1 Tax=Rosa chinensis TaxID=74649 RepID=A0A2P6RME4_ROSCH|nr:stemmadenine O-acetyltransferase [Rosa chinensis]PRQ47609.1 putative alcohol O-acetyltransferase [Rosa chinensis]
MEKIEVSIISRDTIKPSAASSSLHPYKLSIIDQFTPTMYFPVIFFYPITDRVFNLPQTLTDLKNTVSQALTLYYPLSGRIKNNLYIDDFEAGIPFLEARVNFHMIDFLRLPKIEWLNEFVPIAPYRKETISEFLPLLGIQVNIFDSGIAIGVSFSHKINDGKTASCFLKSWVAIFRGYRNKIIHPNLSQAALLLPSRDDLPEKYVAMMERLWFGEKKVVTRRFVFDAKAISALQDEGKSEYVPKPSRVQALTGFLWKHQLAASRALSSGTSTRFSVASQTVNLRSKMNMKTTLDNAIGNIFLWASAQLDLNDTAPGSSDLKLCDLVNLLNESIKEFNSDYLETLKGKEGYGGMCDLLDFMEEGSSVEPAPEFYSFSSWTRFFDQVDFGWGRPSWVGVSGSVGNRNFTTFVETQCDDGIEAWVTLDEKQMAMLEQDPQFLAFASPNPRISITSSVGID